MTVKIALLKKRQGTKIALVWSHVRVDAFQMLFEVPSPLKRFLAFVALERPQIFVNAVNVDCELGLARKPFLTDTANVIRHFFFEKVVISSMVFGKLVISQN